MVLAPGHHLYATDDGAWRVALPQDRFVRISGDPSALSAFQRLVHGVAEPGTQPREEAEALAHLRDLFAARELLRRDTTPAAQPRSDRPTAHVENEGDSPLGRVVAGLLESVATVVQGPVDEDAVRSADVIVSCAGWLPDARWRELDSWCAAHGTAWHRLHAEDVRFFLGPLTVPGRTASYEDLRGRRLAACDMAEELLRHWAYLEDPDQAKPAVSWPDEAGLAVIGGLLAHDVLTYLRTGTPAVVDREVEVEVSTARVVHHPVLALPLTREDAP